QVAGNVRSDSGGRNRLVVQNLLQDVQVGLAPERRPAGEQLVQDDAQGVDVRRRPNLAPTRRGLVRGHVGGGADDGATLRLPRRGLLAKKLRQAEVGDPGGQSTQYAVRCIRYGRWTGGLRLGRRCGRLSTPYRVLGTQQDIPGFQVPV